MLGADRKIVKPTRLINLYQYASSKQKKLEDVNEQKLKNSSKLSKNWSYGLDTLIHFNDSVNLSSIRNLKNNESKSVLEGQYSNRYQKYIDDAKIDIQALRSKRIRFEKQWKGRKAEEQRKFQDCSLDESLAESEVTPYDYSSQLQKNQKAIENETIKEKDGFILQLKRQILSQKVVQFSKKIKNYSFKIFFKQLKVWGQLINFQNNCRFRTITIIFSQWKDLTQTLQQRKNIRKEILKRIRQNRKNLIDDNFDAALYYSKET